MSNGPKFTDSDGNDWELDDSGQLVESDSGLDIIGAFEEAVEMLLGVEDN